MRTTKMSMLFLAAILLLSVQQTDAKSTEEQKKARVRAALIQLRTVIDKQLYQLEALHNQLLDQHTGDPKYYELEFQSIVEDAHRLYMDCDVEATKLGGKPLHKYIVDLRKGNLYASQYRHGVE